MEGFSSPRATEKRWRFLIFLLSLAVCFSIGLFVSASGTDVRNNIVDLTQQQLGKPYGWGDEGPYSFDCSGLVFYVYNKAGINIQRTSAAWYYRMSEDIDDPNTIFPGDLVFLQNTGRRQGITHIGIYIGNGYIIEAANPYYGIIKSKLDDWINSGHWAGARRVKTEYWPDQDNSYSVYSALLVSQSEPTTILQGQTKDVWVEYKNTGTETWKNYGDERIMLAAYPLDRASFFKSGNWLEETRPCTFGHLEQQEQIVPGEIARFDITLFAPSDIVLGDYTEEFALVWGEDNWIDDSQVSFKIKVIELGLDKDSPWPMFHHDQYHTGQSLYQGAKLGKLKWKFKTGDEISSSPVIGKDGIIYVGSNDKNLYAINPDGSLRWKFKTKGLIDTAPAISSDGNIFVGSSDGKLYALDPDGNLVWDSSDLGGIDFSSPVIVSEGTLYIGSRTGYLYAIDSAGSIKWKYYIGGLIRTAPAVGQDGTIYVGSWNNPYLYAVNSDGTLKWKYGLSGNIGLSSPAIFSDGTIYVGVSVFGTGFYTINPDGSLKWSILEDKTIQSSPAISSDNIIYVGSESDQFYAIDPDGNIKWIYSTNIPGATFTTSPAIDKDGTAYIATDEQQGRGKLYSLDSNGNFKWGYDIGSNRYSSPAIGRDNTTYIGSSDGYLYGIE